MVKKKLKRPKSSPRCFVVFDAAHETYYSATLRRSRLLCWHEMQDLTKTNIVDAENLKIVPVRITPIAKRRRTRKPKSKSTKDPRP